MGWLTAIIYIGDVFAFGVVLFCMKNCRRRLVDYRDSKQTWPKEQKEIPEPAMQVEVMPSVQPVLGVNLRFSGSKGSQIRMSVSH